MQSSMKATSVAVLTTMQINVSMMVWSGSGTAGDALVVVDNTGRDVWRAVAQAAAYDLSLSYGERPVNINGLNVTTIGSGTLTVHYR